MLSGKKANGKIRYGAASTTDLELLAGSSTRSETLNRSLSVGVGITSSSLNPSDMNRQTLYKELPFISVSGMQFKEQRFARTLSRMSLAEFGVEPMDLSARLHEIDVDEVLLTTPLITAVLITVTLMFLNGFNTGVMNALEPYVYPGHTITEWSLAVAVFAVGGPFGAILAGKVSNLKGRRMAVILNMWLFLLGGIVLLFSPTIYYVILGRGIVGFSSGYASVIIPIYLGELAPPTLRGSLGTLTQFSLVSGILASNLLSFVLATEELWPYFLGLNAFLAVIQLLASPLIVESPRWLLSRDGNVEQASILIKKLRGFRSDMEVEKEVNFIQEASKMQRLEGHTSAHGSGAAIDLLRDERVQILVVSFIVLHASQQLSGINAVFYYSTSFFEGIISNPLVGTATVGAINVLAVYVALKLMDKFGRVTLLLWSSGGMLLSCVTITLSLLNLVPNYIALVGVMAFVSFFEIGLGPIPWLIVAEMFDAKYVATAMSIACQINWVSNFIVGLGFPSLNAALGSWVFAPFSAILLGTFIFCLLFLPETAGKTHKEIERLINPIRMAYEKNGLQYVVVNDGPLPDEF